MFDIYMRLRRLKEELPILDEEMARFSARQTERMAYMGDQLEDIDSILSVPELERASLGEPTTRYTLVRPSDDVLAGLRAVFAETLAAAQA